MSETLIPFTPLLYIHPYLILTTSQGYLAPFISQMEEEKCWSEKARERLLIEIKQLMR